MKSFGPFAVVLAVTMSLAAPSAALDQGRGRGQGQQKQAGKSTRKADKDVVVFDRNGHARVIRDYRRAGLPPGLAKRETLPPGLRRQLRERGELPPGLQKRLVGVPGDLASRLPGIPPYYQRYFAGDDLVVVDTRTNTIVAIVRDVLR